LGFQLQCLVLKMYNKHMKRYKNQMLSSNNDVGHHAFKNAKRELQKILDRFKNNGRLKTYSIVSTNNLAVKHPLFEYARSFDFIIVTDVGLINVDVKNWNQKTFYHFDVPDKHFEEKNQPYDTDQIVGHYVSSRYHSQFNTTRTGVYTFTEILQDNRVIYEFYDQDPYQQAANNAKALKDQIESDYRFKIQSIGVVYFSDGSVNIIEGSDESDKYVDTVSTQSSLEKVIEDAIQLSKHPLNDEQVQEISESFK
ncbi:NERD domain-containing protein, partial [Staphylococcus capitis]|uniref:NERD domain-containing protein n=1 Tax=Staphylococcus capitis TaxID=29388 RepID=UPI0020070D47